MITNPEKIYFESTDDAVNYVSKGLVPRKKDYEKLVNALNNEEGNGIRFSEDVTTNADAVAHVLDIIYTNRVKHRNISIAAMAGFFIAGIFLGGKASSCINEKHEVRYVSEERERY